MEKKIRISTFYLFISLLFFALISCNKENEEEQMLNYEVRTYFEDLTGNYIEETSLLENCKCKKNDRITITPKEYIGFTFNEKESVIDHQVVDNYSFALKYDRNTYSIFIEGENTPYAQGKYQEQIELQPLDNPDFKNWVLVCDNESKLENNILTIGAGDITIKSEIYDLEIDNSTFLGENGIIKASLKPNNEVVFLYNTENSVNFEIDNFIYYSIKFANESEDNKLLSLNYIQNQSVTELDSFNTKKDQLNITIEYNNKSIIIKENDDILINHNATINYGGRIGTNKCSLTTITYSNGFSLDEAKTYYKDISSTFYIPAYKVNKDYLSIKKEIDKYYAIVYPNLIDFVDANNKIIDDSQSLDILHSNLCHLQSIKEKLAIEVTWSRITCFVQDLSDCLLVPYVGRNQKVAIENIELSSNIMDIDNRWWTPSAYQIISSSGNGLLTKINELLIHKTSYNEIVEISNKYIIDLIRAVCWHSLEYYYYHCKALGLDVFNVWWYLYDYYTSNDSDNFVYVGNLSNFEWKKENGFSFRLSGWLFNKENLAFSNDIDKIINNYFWMHNYQTVQQMEYQIILNTNGGFVENDVIKVKGEYSLPIPTKEGCIFEGWYENKNYYGEAVTKCDGNCYSNKTYYAKWSTNNTFMPNKFFGENMILQKGDNVKVYGIGENGKQVIVQYGDITKTTIINNGQWEIDLGKLDYDKKGKNLIITCDDIKFNYDNVKVGDVWLCSGQSNMEAGVNWFAYKVLPDLGQYNNYDLISIYYQDTDKFDSSHESFYNQDTWYTSDNISKAFSLWQESIIGLTFALQLQQNLNYEVPIGIIVSARGGTYIEEWLSKDSINEVGSTLSDNEKSKESRYYNSATIELMNLNFKGVLWYQGENNCDNYTKYPDQFYKLVSQWRTMFNNDSLPIIYMQLVQYSGLDFSNFRVMQWDLQKNISNIYPVCGVDFGDYWDIHPSDKIPYAQRAAAVAANKVYGLQSFNGTSQTPSNISLIDNTITISFNTKITLINEMKYLEIFDKNNNLLNYEYKIDYNKIIITNINGEPATIKYLVAKTFDYIPLIDEDNLPIAPFIYEII